MPESSFLKKSKENEKRLLMAKVKGTQELMKGGQCPTLEQSE